MRRRYAVLMGFLLVIAVVPAGSAQTDAFVTEVQQGDSDASRAASPADLRIVYVDADGDDQLDAENPDEPAYLASGETLRVEFGDIRLTPFLHYPTGTAVNYTNRDIGLPVDTIDGWFARDAGGTWFVDTDRDGAVDVGDLEVRPGSGVAKVRPGAPEIGTALTPVQSSFSQSERFIRVDQGASGPNWEDDLYLDLDGNQQANPGELRFQVSRLGIDDTPTGREFHDAIARLEASQSQLRDELLDNDQQTQSRVDTLESDLAQTQAELEQARADLSTMDDWLLALGLLDLVAVAGVAFWVHRSKTGSGSEGR